MDRLKPIIIICIYIFTKLYTNFIFFLFSCEINQNLLLEVVVVKLTEYLGHSLKKIEILVIITYSYKTENVVVVVARKSGSVVVKNWMEIISLGKTEEK